MRILFFAQLKDLAGCSELEWPGAEPLTAEQLWQQLLAKFPDLAAHRQAVRLARNWEYAQPDTIFSGMDEVALIPPVSGG